MCLFTSSACLQKDLAAKTEMNSENRHRGQTATYEADTSVNRISILGSHEFNGMKQENLKHCQTKTEDSCESDILIQLHSQQLLIVNSRRRNGLIIYKHYYAEFAGPGAAVGGQFDTSCHGALAVGNLSLVEPESADERQRAYLIRRQWVRLMKQITDNPVPLQRAQMVLNQFENYFDAKTIAQMPDEALALLVGVLPQTIRKVRQGRSE